METKTRPLTNPISDDQLLESLLLAESRDELEGYKACIRDNWGVVRLNAIARRLSPDQREHLASLPEVEDG